MYKRCARICAGIIALGLALGGVAACDLADLVQATVQAQRVQTASYTLTGTPSVNLLTANGAVVVRGVAGQPDIRVTATLTARGATTEEAEDRLSRLTIEMKQEGNAVTLRYVGADQDDDVRRHSGVAFEVTMPVMGNVQAATSNGSITIAGLEATAQLTTSNGSIEVRDFSGEADAETSNGRISVERAQGTFSLDTSNGEIRLRDVNALVHAETSNGEISFRGVFAQGIHSLRTSNGRINVEIPASSAVRFQVETSNASISTDLPLLGDTQGTSWDATLNAPAESTVTLRTSNGSVRIGRTS